MRINLHLFAIYAYFLRLCSVLVCWTFIVDFYDSSLDFGRNVWDESKLKKLGPWGSKDDSKKGPKIPQERQKTCGPRRRTERPKRGARKETEPSQPVATTARPFWTPRPVVAATVWPCWAPRPWWRFLHPVVRFSFACLFDFRRFLLCFVFIFAMYLDI